MLKANGPSAKWLVKWLSKTSIFMTTSSGALTMKFENNSMHLNVNVSLTYYVRFGLVSRDLIVALSASLNVGK